MYKHKYTHCHTHAHTDSYKFLRCWCDLVAHLASPVRWQQIRRVCLLCIHACVRVLSVCKWLYLRLCLCLCVCLAVCGGRLRVRLCVQHVRWMLTLILRKINNQAVCYLSLYKVRPAHTHTYTHIHTHPLWHCVCVACFIYSNYNNCVGVRIK